MKINNKILAALMLVGLSTATIAQEKEIKVIVKDVNGTITKTVTVNGKELNDEEITAMQASGDLEVIHLDNRNTKKMMFIESDGSDGFVNENIEILINADGDKLTKKIMMNGKQLSNDEIEKLELEGKLQALNIDTSGSSSMHEVMLFNTDASIGADGVNEILVQTEFIQGNNDQATLGFMANISDDGWQVISVIEGSGAQEAGLKAGDMIKFMGDKDLTQGANELSETLDLVSYQAGEMIDLEVLRDGNLVYMSIEARKNNAFDMVINVNSEDHIWEMNTQGELFQGENKVSLGFLPMRLEDGLHVGYIYDESGAQIAGLQENDIIKKIADVDFDNNDTKEKDLSDLPQFKVGEFVVVEIERNGVPMQFSIEAKKLNIPSMPHIQNPQKFFSWLERVEGYSNNEDKKIKVMVMDGNKVGKSINFDDVDVNLPDMIGNMNIFITDGRSTSKLLGKNHEMSSLSEDLGKYFNTKNGVLILHVDESNAFALKDGDVIKSINGNDVNSPKDVIKNLIKADDQKKIKLKVVRHKKNKTLKYRK